MLSYHVVTYLCSWLVLCSDASSRSWYRNSLIRKKSSWGLCHGVTYLVCSPYSSISPSMFYYRYIHRLHNSVTSSSVLLPYAMSLVSRTILVRWYNRTLSLIEIFPLSQNAKPMAEYQGQTSVLTLPTRRYMSLLHVPTQRQSIPEESFKNTECNEHHSWCHLTSTRHE